jgi:2-polyprenyl-3-methyl-5-hydroxy-6-metoxy-1,4-benzoquinol methylase
MTEQFLAGRANQTDSRQIISDRYRPNPRSYLPLSKVQETTRNAVLEKLTNGTYQLSRHKCPLCESNEFAVIAERDRYSLPVQTLACCKCGLLLTNPLMRSSDYADFYQNHYTSLYEGFQCPPAEFFDGQQSAGKRLYDTVRQHVDLREMRVAEVGCAAGGILWYFQSYCKEAVGCDFGTDFMAYGKTRGLKLKIGGVETLREERPDVIIYSHVLEHILDINAELETVASILPPEGILIIDVPGVYNIPNAYESDFLRYLQNAHLVHFTAETLTAMMAKHGFSKIHADERCIAVFRKTGLRQAPPVSAEGNAHLKTTQFLKDVESARLRVKARLFPRKVAVAILKALRIHSFARRVYRKLRAS